MWVCVFMDYFCTMTERELLVGRYNRALSLQICNEIRAGGDIVGFCRRFLHDGDCRVVRNALLCVSKAGKGEIASLDPLKDEFMDLAMTTNDRSVRRLSLSIVERMGIAKGELRVDFLDFCLARMVDMCEKPAIQALCMRLAFGMCGFYPELRGEFLRSVEAMETERCSPAVRCVIRKVLNPKRH